jgi:hypothetical protein
MRPLAGLVKAVMVAGLYPNVIKVNSSSGGAKKGGKGGKGSLKLTTRSTDGNQEEKVRE